MINSITFYNFRGLKRLELSKLSQITLLTGRNNAGKSSVLVVIFLLMYQSAAESFGNIINFRGIYVRMDPGSLWAPAFYGLNTEESMLINGNIDGDRFSLEYVRDDSFVPAANAANVPNAFSPYAAIMGSTYTLKYHFQKEEYEEDCYFTVNESGLGRNIKTNQQNNQLMPMTRTTFVNPVILNNSLDGLVSDWLSKMDLAGKKQDIIEYLKTIEPELSNIITITNQGQVQVYAKVGEQVLPIRLAGDGLSRLLFILLAIAANPDSIILIDEIETGFHYSMLETLWKLIAKSAKDYNCQIIATTHSYECIQKAVQGIKRADMERKFCLYRVEHRDGENYAFQFDGEMARQSVEMNMEVR